MMTIHAWGWRSSNQVFQVYVSVRPEGEQGIPRPSYRAEADTKSKEIAVQNGYCGLYTQGQDNNPGACLFYLHSGFYIGGLDTNVYRHTKQEGKADILFIARLTGRFRPAGGMQRIRQANTNQRR